MAVQTPYQTFEQGEWQIVDFMKRLNLPWPLEDDTNVPEKRVVFELVAIEGFSSRNNQIQPFIDVASRNRGGTFGKRLA